MPSTPRVVQALPGPTPTRTPTAPVRMRWRPAWYEAHPPTMTGRSNSADEALQIQRLRGLRHVLGRDDGSLNDQKVELGGQAGGGQRLGALRRDRRRRRDARLLHLADAGRHQLGLDRLAVHLLHARRGLLVVELADLLEEVGRILVAGPQALEIQDAEPAQPAQLDGRRRADGSVHGRPQQRQLETVGVDLPGDVDVLGIPRPPAGDDGDVVQTVGLPPRLEDADLDLSHLFALRHSMGPVRLTVHTGMSIANAGPTRRRSTTLLSPHPGPGHPATPNPTAGRSRRCWRRLIRPGRGRRSAARRGCGPSLPRSVRLPPRRTRPGSRRAGSAVVSPVIVQRSSWKAPGSARSRSETSKTRSTSAGLATRCGRAGTLATIGMMTDPIVTVTTGWVHPSTVTSAGSSATSSKASRSAAPGGSSPGSRRPPGKLT